MNKEKSLTSPQPGQHQRGAEKTARIPVKIQHDETPLLRKPAWIRSKIINPVKIGKLKNTLRENQLFTVCEEAACPNLGECFSSGTATFMILGDICTRRCPFCDVAHGRPQPVDGSEAQKLAATVKAMSLNYVVITSVDRDDLRDGGAQHFVDCISALREVLPQLKIEILTPDFRGRMKVALEIFKQAPPNVFNHNLETVPRLYKAVRPGADYLWSLQLLQAFKALHPQVPTKSGLMLGVGETLEEVEAVMRDLREHDCEMLTLGQYLQPTRGHLPVKRYVTPAEFEQLKTIGLEMGFAQVASGPLVRSSYHADKQAADLT
ncbi:lipoyl synthase [Candidatus Venteria ishoeyi]|uniref:Lipoyl synthase n=1 Tax=Candidatus Venteria ishoeyi TaxID=1899563 RepID=A0A1H6F932_9GAMM|nr:lipoyl synthase [Candidatus Venteria ishoeyi]MDM8544915.1 lipoyl synthase [Candidatus Venteria ishoeyi]SEH05809.1 Lipoyl synthase [Candidatus Venteria ishoeyi]